jgi:putative ABC transport system permease protein
MGFMTATRRLALRIANLFRSTAADRELERELASHMALLEEEYQQQGLSVDEARLAARRSLGRLDSVRQTHREARSLMWMADVGRDLQYASRTLVKTPGFTLAAVLTLGVAIGGATAVFSLLDAVLLRPLPFAAADRLVLLFEENARAGFARDAVRPRTYAAWKADNDVLESVAAVAEKSAVLRWQGQPLRITAPRVTASFFDVLKAQPVLGRVFTAGEDRPGEGRVVIISHVFWQRRFGGDPTVIGRQLILDDEPHVIVGVMAPDFQFLQSYVSAWVPAALGPDEIRYGGRYLTVVGRMKPDVDRARVTANLDTIAARQSQLFPADERWRTLRSVVWPLSQELAGDVRRPFAVLVAAMAVVLLIACANLASLLLARAASRRQEMAVRGALGASRARVVRQLLTESLALAGLGLVLGVVLARWALVFLEQLVPPSMVLFARLQLDARAFASAAVIAVGAALLFGLAPALRTSAASSGDALKSGRRVTGDDRGRRALVVAQVAMTLVLLTGAGLLLQTFYEMRYANLGLQPARVLTLRTVLPLDRYGEHGRRAEFYDRVLDRLAAEPGVEAAGYTTSVPLEWKGGTSSLAIEGTPRDPALAYDANHRQISAGYFETVGVPLQQGRFFRPGDDDRAPLVVIVNEALARQYWPGENPVGRRLAIDPGQAPQWRTVVGVVGDVRQMGLDVPARAEIYIPYRQMATQPWFTPRDLVVRTAGDPTLAVDAVSRVVHSVDPGLAISNIRPLDEVLDEEVASRRVGTTLLISFAAFALVLAVVGLYGVIAYFVVQHVPELGVRMALGAQRRDIMRFVLARGMSLAVVGVLVGTVAAIALPRIMASLLYGVTGGTLIWLIVSLLLLTLSLVASYLPARHATRLDPVAALRPQ